MTAITKTYDEVLQTIQTWPPDQRFTLVQDILQTLAPQFKSSRTQRKTLQKALGLLASDDAPSDEQVEQWLDERRTEKYA